uniref:Uncharacterized protein n=1 Tax=Anguilla anguilla TaxID=7936 RepID=A0A0E9T918_ANGAN
MTSVASAEHSRLPMQS